MAAVRNKGTKPEMLVRQYLFRHGYRYRINYSRLPGRPDIVLPKYRVVILVNGCFWHGHKGCKHSALPETNAAFWRAKIESNVRRDEEERRILVGLGWRCITVWECQLKPAEREKTLTSLVRALDDTYPDNREAHYTLSDEGGALTAAEPCTGDGVNTVI